MKHSQFIFVLMATTAFGAANVYADRAGDEGVADACGTGCSYTISEDGKTLTITGTGTDATIKNDAFAYSDDTRFTNIENVIVTGTISSIGDYAFLNKNLTSVTISDSVTSIGNGAFHSNNLTSVTIPDSVTSIGGWAFNENNLTSVVIPDSVTSIGNYAFYDNNLISVVIPDSVTSIEDYAFSMNNLTSIVIPDSVTSIGEYAFFNNNLTSVTIPDSVTSIEDYAFGFNYLTSVVIPDSVTSIGEGAFLLSQANDLVCSAENLQRYLDASGKFAYSGDINLTCTTGDCLAKLQAWDESNDTNYVARAVIQITNADGSISSYKNGIFQSRIAQGTDGSTYAYDENGNLIAIKGKRIYTIDEATKLSKKTGNTFRLRYK
ncbi:MAG: leucine-rich repeat protein [Alphaproteobacteria bacterium]|nr:leucine-rich repeat protein [Alphaproteobacteria bacterium]